MAPWQALPAERPLSFAQTCVKVQISRFHGLCTALHSLSSLNTTSQHTRIGTGTRRIRSSLSSTSYLPSADAQGAAHFLSTNVIPLSSPQHSPQSCSSEASAQSVMPLQCLLVEMQVPLGHWKPLHFFSEIRYILPIFFSVPKAQPLSPFP